LQPKEHSNWGRGGTEKTKAGRGEKKDYSCVLSSIKKTSLEQEGLLVWDREKKLDWFNTLGKGGSWAGPVKKHEKQTRGTFRRQTLTWEKETSILGRGGERAGGGTFHRNRPRGNGPLFQERQRDAGSFRLAGRPMGGGGGKKN